MHTLIDTRKERLKAALMDLALNMEPDLIADELDNYLTDGISDAFTNIIASEENPDALDSRAAWNCMHSVAAE